MGSLYLSAKLSVVKGNEGKKSVCSERSKSNYSNNNSKNINVFLK